MINTVNNESFIEPMTEKDINKDLLKGLVSSFYQVQKVRIQVGNKLTAHFYRKLGISAVETLVKQKQGDKKTELDLMDVLKLEFKRITDALATEKIVRESSFKKLTEENRGIFSAYVEFSWMQQYRQVLASENSILKDIENSLNLFPIWTEFLSTIRGVGPTMGGIIISYIDIHKAETPASLAKYAGLDVVPTKLDGSPDGRGRGKYRDHLVKVEYTNASGAVQTRDSVTFNPFLKTKLVGVLADVMIKHRTPIYREEYDNYKNRITQREEMRFEKSKRNIDYNNKLAEIEEIYIESLKKLESTPSKKTKTEIKALKIVLREERDTAIEKLDTQLYKKLTPVHIHKMSIRYMIKRLLVALYVKWRTLEGLPVTEEYAVRKLKMTHHVSSRYGLQYVTSQNLPQESEETPPEF